MTDEQYAALPFPAAAELANMYRYYREWPLYDDNRCILLHGRSAPPTCRAEIGILVLAGGA